MSLRVGRPGQRFFVTDFETTGLHPDQAEPIEIGIIVCDERFNALESFNSFIRPQAGDRAFQEDETWPAFLLPAYAVHKITAQDLKHAPSRQAVGERVKALCALHTKDNCKPVLVSDNARFEWMFMEQLVGEDPAKHFHYCAWDSSLLLEATGVGDPVPAHRALADVGLLHAAIIKALDRARSIK